MLKISDEESRNQFLMIGLMVLVVLLVLAGIVKPLIVPEGVEIQLDSILYSMFLSAATGVFSVAFIILSLDEENTLIRIICIVPGFLLAISAAIGVDLIVMGLLATTGAILLTEVILFVAFAFLIISAGIYILRRTQ